MKKTEEKKKKEEPFISLFFLFLSAFNDSLRGQPTDNNSQIDAVRRRKKRRTEGESGLRWQEFQSMRLFARKYYQSALALIID